MEMGGVDRQRIYKTNIPVFATWQYHSYRQDSKAMLLLQKADMAAGGPLD